MNSTAKATLLVGSGLVAGLALAMLAIWNPLESGWIDGLLSRTHPESEPSVADETATPAAGSSATESRDREILYWRAPMDPNFVSDQPGKSPMGMDLVPVYAEEDAVQGIRVSQSFLQNFAVRTTQVVEGSLPIEIRTLGVLAHNEERVFSVNTKFEGWIETARFNTVGERVNAGEVLFEIYSPQLVTTQQEYLATLDYVEKLSASDAYPDAIDRARSLLGSTRERLHYWDMTEEQIEALKTSGRANRTIEFVSPVSGFIVEKMGDSLEGMKLAPGMTVLKIADHSTLWAEVEFYEKDIRHLREKQRVSIEVEAFPGRRWSGRILFFDPAINPETRTLKGFVEIANPDLRLRPQMFVNVFVRASGVKGALLVPDQAVLHSGKRAIVIVAKGRGVFEPREVELGLAGEGLQEISSGVSSGESVVTSSQFLIDSESNLKAALSQLLGDFQPAKEQKE